MAHPKITWRAKEHGHFERSGDWYWIVAIIGVAGCILSLFFSNFLFAILILLATGTIMLQAREPAKIVDFEINRQGVIANDIIYPFSTLRSFWVIDEAGPDDMIILKSKRLLFPIIIIPFNSETMDAEEIRNYLLEYLDEEHMREPLAHRILDIFGV